jgi:hypothetical protein
MEQENHQQQVSIEGKFVQLLWRKREYLLFSPFELHRYHNQILARFLKDKDIDHRWTNEITLEMDDHELKVVGGGRFRLDQDEQTLHLWDNSQAYGRFKEFGMSARIGAAEVPWRDFEISIS